MNLQDGPDLSRREFMMVGTTSLLAIDGSVVPQVDSGSVDTSEFEFDGAVDLVGPTAAKPAPGSEFFENKLAYAYRYKETDEDQYTWFITEDRNSWKNISMTNPETQVDEVRTREFTAFLDHTFARPEAPDDKNWLYTDADVTKVQSEVELASTTTLESTQRGNYAPGTDAIPGFAARVTGTPTAGRADFGYFTADDGFGAGEDTTDSYVFLRKGGTETLVHRPNWNGHVPDGRVWDSNWPVITRFPHLFYGGGAIEVRAVMHDGDTTRLRTLHTFTPVNTPGDGPPFDQPNLPIAFESDGLTGGSLRANAAHYEFGHSEAETRVNGEHITGTSVGTGGFEHIISWRKRDGWEMVNVKPLEIALAASNSDAIFELQLDPTLNDESDTAFSLPTNTDSDETAVEVSTSNSITTAGNRRWVGFAVAGQGNRAGSPIGEDLNFNLPAAQIVTLAGQGVGGTSDLFGDVEWQEFF